MLERLVIAVVLLVLGVVAYRVLTRCQIRRGVQALANADPLLNGLRPGVPTVLYFTTPMCIPCKTQQQPTLERLQTELGPNGIQVIRVDATEQPEAADRWGVFCAPTTFILDGYGQPCEVNHGVADANKLKRQIQSALAAAS